VKNFLILILLPIVLLGCGDGVDLITKDIAENMASCYEGTEITDDNYIVSFDKHCIDIELVPSTTVPTTVVSDNPPVAIPTDAEWELIATLQRNPLRPAEFYLFDEDNEAIAAAYIAGKHFIFEIGGENIGRQVNKERHYIIQPEPPFQDKHKDAAQLAHEQRTGFKSGAHTYMFLSSGWYTPLGKLIGGGGEATGLLVEFSEFIKPTANFELNVQGRNYIKEWARLRVYVSR